MKELECPNCGAGAPVIISQGEFRCKFCDTLYYNQNLLDRKRAAEKKAANLKVQEERQRAKIEQARSTNSMGKRILIFVSIVLIIVFAFVGYMAKKSMDESAKANEEMIKNFQKEK